MLIRYTYSLKFTQEIDCYQLIDSLMHALAVNLFIASIGENIL